MEITDIETTVVMIPNKFEFGMSPALHLGRAFTILEMSTDEGIVGLGQTYGSEPKLLIDDIARSILIGQDPFRVEFLEARLRSRIANLTTIGGIEMALFDLMGKAVGRPVCDLIGGRYRDEVEFFAYLNPGYKGAKGIIHDLEIPYGAPVSEISHGEGGRFTTGDIVKWARWLVDKCGFRVIEWKTGILSPRFDIETMRLLREEFGPDMALRIDCNGAWTPETAIRTIRAMNQYDLRNAEDPTSGLSGNARVRRATGVPVSSLHSPSLSDVIAASNAGLDGVVPNIVSSGGILMSKKLVAVAEACGINCWTHTAGDTSIMNAARLHFLASTPYIIEPSQTGYNLRNLDDITRGSPMIWEDGCLAVPEGPGFGVELDKNKVEKYHKLWVEEASKAGQEHFYEPHMGGMYPDYHRPEWFPKVRPGWMWDLDGRE